MVYLTPSIAPFLFESISVDQTAFFVAVILALSLSLLESSIQNNSTCTAELTQVINAEFGLLSIFLSSEERVVKLTLSLFTLVIASQIIPIS